MSVPKQTPQTSQAPGSSAPAIQKGFDSLMNPLIAHCHEDTEKAVKQQQELLTLLGKIHSDLLRINENHYKDKDEVINKRLDKVMQQYDRVNTLKVKLEAMQKRVSVVEGNFKKLKDEIPELKKHTLLAESGATSQHRGGEQTQK